MIVYLAAGVLVAFSFIPNQVGESTCNFSVFTFSLQIPNLFAMAMLFVQYQRQIRRQLNVVHLEKRLSVNI